MFASTPWYSNWSVKCLCKISNLIILLWCKKCFFLSLSPSFRSHLLLKIYDVVKQMLLMLLRISNWIHFGLLTINIGLNIFLRVLEKYVNSKVVCDMILKVLYLLWDLKVLLSDAWPIQNACSTNYPKVNL